LKFPRPSSQEHPKTSQGIQPSIILTVLLVIFDIAALCLLRSNAGLLPLDTSGAPAAKGRGEGKVNVFLRVETNDEGWDVDDLLADTVCMGGSVYFMNVEWV
jgi:hypothetical protein